MIDNPYLVKSPCLISFSGGRTSAYMLWHVLEAYNGHLPDNVFVCFANTGKERQETLDFVANCENYWGVKIHWLEWQPEKPYFKIVDWQTASRDGQPFARLIRKKGMLPNVVTRYCTEKLKIETMQAFMKSQGLKEYYNAIGLRFDEPHRVAKNKHRIELDNLQQSFMYEHEVMVAPKKAKKRKKSKFIGCYPLFDAKATARDITKFWSDNKQGFDLGLRKDEGNCDLCMLKGQGKLVQLMHTNPSLSLWWQEQEKLRLASKPSGARFIKDVSYSQLQWIADNQENFVSKLGNMDLDQESVIDCFCTD